ncbi:MAG: hypothetical protein OJF49_004087 [Ktedonobacterales bacterium]|nr:MAG: hypothetical protein OJF49_004087 [Ktedonobacterales bacterium]
MAGQPLAEVFGFPPDNLSLDAERYRRNRLCPYNNKVPSCTKDKAENPLGVCSVHSGMDAVITCPIRFRQDWLIAEDAANFFFSAGTKWTSLTEIRLNDKHGEAAGNIDLVLVAYDDAGRLTEFGALEVQAVYISGNVRRPFEYYLQDPANRYNMEWTGQVRPDFLSSSRKRLAPQLIYKGGIINGWSKKLAVAIDRSFYTTLPTLAAVDPSVADMAFFVYDLHLDTVQNRYRLVRDETIYTMFTPALATITTPVAGPVEDFIQHLQTRLDQKLDGGNPPIAPALLDDPDDM